MRWHRQFNCSFCAVTVSMPPSPHCTRRRRCWQAIEFRWVNEPQDIRLKWCGRRNKRWWRRICVFLSLSGFSNLRPFGLFDISIKLGVSLACISIKLQINTTQPHLQHLHIICLRSQYLMPFKCFPFLLFGRFLLLSLIQYAHFWLFAFTNRCDSLSTPFCLDRLPLFLCVNTHSDVIFVVVFLG